MCSRFLIPSYKIHRHTNEINAKLYDEKPSCGSSVKCWWDQWRCQDHSHDAESHSTASVEWTTNDMASDDTEPNTYCNTVHLQWAPKPRLTGHCNGLDTISHTNDSTCIQCAATASSVPLYGWIEIHALTAIIKDVKFLRPLRDLWNLRIRPTTTNSCVSLWNAANLTISIHKCLNNNTDYRLIMAALCNRGRAIIFLPCSFYLLSFFLFFPHLISVAADWMSTILLHMAWP